MNNGYRFGTSLAAILLLCLFALGANGWDGDNLPQEQGQPKISFQISWGDQNHTLELRPEEFLNFMASPSEFFGVELNKETENHIRNQMSAAIESLISEAKDGEPDQTERQALFHNFSLFVLELYQKVPDNPFVLQLFTQISLADFLVSQVSYLSMMSEGDDAKSIFDRIRGGIFSLWRFGEIITGLRALYATRGISLYFSDIDTDTFIHLMREIEYYRLNQQFKRSSPFRTELVESLIKVGRQLMGIKQTPGGKLLYSQLITFVALSFYMVPEREQLFAEIEKHLADVAVESVNIGSWADSGESLFGSSINQMLRDTLLKSRVEGRIEETLEAMEEIIKEIESVTDIYNELEEGGKIQSSESFWYQAVMGFVVGHVAIPMRIGEVLLVVAEKNEVAPESLKGLRNRIDQCVNSCDSVIEGLHDFTIKTVGHGKPIFDLIGQGASLALSPIQWGATQTMNSIRAQTQGIGQDLDRQENQQNLDSLLIENLTFKGQKEGYRCESVFL